MTQYLRAGSFGKFDILRTDITWDGVTETFRFAQLGPTLLLFAGREIPPHYHAAGMADETWIVLPGSSPLELEFTRRGAEHQLWQRRILEPGDFCHLAAPWTRRAASFYAWSEFHFLAVLSQPVTRTLDAGKQSANSSCV